jgi:beta-glucosidase-like glycosyl hydrolase/CubicO group peptidase (beta-lactamase class C family)
MRRIIIFLLSFFWMANQSFAGGISNDTIWTDSILKGLSLDEKIAQLLFIRAYSTRDSVYEDSLVSIVKTYQVGGICFFRGTPWRQVCLTNRIQSVATIPLLVAIDAEWGLGMRLDSAHSFPRAMTLGAVTNDSLIYTMGQRIADGCRRIGVHINFAPVVDINNNPANPVINFRSFGEVREKVARKGVLFMNGMQDRGIIATAKHFPGHGDTDTDSHVTLPVISHPMKRIDSVELYPFRRLIGAGVKGVMVAHLYLPAIDSSDRIPTTLSGNTINGLLRKNLGFTGLVITDALDMKGVTRFFRPGEIEAKALLAGNDILLLPQNVRTAIHGIREAIDSGMITEEMVHTRCRKILLMKYHSGLSHFTPVPADGLYKDLNPAADSALTNILFRSAITLIKDDVQLIPLKSLDRRRFATISIGDTLRTPFQVIAGTYSKMDHFNLSMNPTKKVADSIIDRLSGYNIILAGLHHISSFQADSFGLSKNVLHFLDTLFRINRSILSVFGNPYSLALIPGLQNAEAIIEAFQDNPSTERAAAELIFGAIPAAGRLPVSVSTFRAGTGEKTETVRLGEVLPDEIGIPSLALAQVDSAAMEGIAAGAYPGCQILLAKGGKVFYLKSFGHPTYGDSIRVSNDHIYDIASVTKVAATTLALMKLFDEGKIRLDDSLGKYLPELRGSNKSGLILRAVLAHQAGLQPWIPFYEKTLVRHEPDPEIYHTVSSADYPLRVAENLYIAKSYPDTIFKAIIDSPLRAARDYKYSDLGFYLLRQVVERLTRKPFDLYLEEEFYKPLGLQSTGFRPLEKFEKMRLIPSELDSVFRMQVIRGDVNDPGAAMLGGISGHAGLFSNTLDLAVIMQLLIQDGQYGGRQYIQPSTVREFTRVQFPGNGNRRGLGFDKPLLTPSPDGPCFEGASPASFGHSGFTGTFVWADPENDLVYIFLSNRAYPDAHNTKLAGLNIRTNIQKIAYDLLKKYQVK